MKLAKLLLVSLFFTNSFLYSQETQEITIPSESQLILIKLKTKTLQLFEKGELIYEFPIRIGGSLTPTPVGEGRIYAKRKKPIFRYVDPGPKQGQIIRLAECGDGFKKVDYSKMRALGIKIRGMIRYSIHSTTCSETIGTAISNGCIGMTIPDMLKLYPRVLKGATIKIAE